MKAKTEEALEKSIRHWHENVAAPRPEDVKVGAGHCALCELFFDDFCAGCPVRDRSGEMRCMGTPYGPAIRALEDWREALTGRFPRILGGLAHRDWRQAARAELEFLRSLRVIPESGR